MRTVIVTNDFGFASIVICGYEHAEETSIPCIQNLLAVTEYPYELICVDDGSKDQGATIDFFAEVADKPFRLPQNSGTAAARNVGFLAHSGNPIAFLDNDIFPPRGWLRLLVAACDVEGVGIAAGIPSNEIERRNKAPGADGLIEFDHVGGGFCAITPECFRAVGYFDEFLRNNGQDTDYCYRAKERGFRVVTVPDLVAKHLQGGTRRYMDKERMEREARYFRKKHANRPDLPMPPLRPFGADPPIL